MIFNTAPNWLNRGRHAGFCFVLVFWGFLFLFFIFFGGVGVVFKIQYNICTAFKRQETFSMIDTCTFKCLKKNHAANTGTKEYKINI